MKCMLELIKYASFPLWSKSYPYVIPKRFILWILECVETEWSRIQSFFELKDDSVALEPHWTAGHGIYTCRLDVKRLRSTCDWKLLTSLKIKGEIHGS